MLLSLGLISSMIISWTLWAGERAFPKFPALSWIPQFPEPFDTLVIVAVFGTSLFLALRPLRITASIALGLMLILALQDQMRWQPWFYQYLLMLIPIAFLRAEKKSNAEAILAIHRIIIASIYLWSGIHKCHSGFLSVHADLVKPITESTNIPIIQSMISGLGYAVPLIEIFMAIGLFFSPTRKTAIYTIIITHITILILLGPLKGEFSNAVIWPWNLVMIGMTIMLFGKLDTVRLNPLKLPRVFPIAAFAFGLTAIAPAFFYTGSWDRYLSFNLYGGWQKRVLFKIEQDDLAKLPPNWQSRCAETNALDHHLLLSPSSWSFDELKVPFISEWRIIRRFSRQLCELGIGGEEIFIYVDYRHLPEKPKRYFTCPQISTMRDQLPTLTTEPTKEPQE